VEGMVTVCFKAVFRGSIHNHPFIWSCVISAGIMKGIANRITTMIEILRMVKICVILEILAVITAFWDVMPCSLVDRYRICCCHLQHRTRLHGALSQRAVIFVENLECHLLSCDIVWFRDRGSVLVSLSTRYYDPKDNNVRQTNTCISFHWNPWTDEMACRRPNSV
jgi:hypothetical protein